MPDKHLTSLTIRRPDDWHLHLRDGEMLKAVLPETTRHFARAIIMPNLVPPVVTSEQAVAYRARIMAAVPDGAAFTPLMTLYLTEATDPEDVRVAHANGIATAVKLYPAGATTNSASGVRDFEKVRPVLEVMAEIGMPLCVHGEVTDHQIDIFDREAVFIDKILKPLRKKVPDLKIVMEHVTTQDAVDYVRDSHKNLAATITTHHLVINRNFILAGGIKPHYYCLPVAKRSTHQAALRRAATSGSARFFLGAASAPHKDADKETGCGCAGCYTAPVTMSCLAHVFEEEGALDRLEAFSSLNGPAHYGLPANSETITLEKRTAPVPPIGKRHSGAGPITVLDPGHDLYWHVV